MAKFCKECGKPIEPNSKFCNECGASLQENQGGPNGKKPKKGMEPWQIAIIIGIVVIAAGVILAIVFANKSSDKATTAAVTTAEESITLPEIETEKETTKATTTAAEPWKLLDGSFTAADTSTLFIKGNKDYVAVTLDLYKLAKIDMEGQFDGEVLKCSGLDPNGTKIQANIYFKDEKTIRVEFTDSQWDYIKKGDTFDFPTGK